MPKRLKILALAPETPQIFGAGVRTYHFAKALVAQAEVKLCVLGKEKPPGMPEDLAVACDWIRHLPADYRYATGKNNGKASAALRVIRTLLTPWRNGGEDMVLAWENQCLERTADLSGGWKSLPRRVYAEVLRREVQFKMNLSGLLPKNTSFLAKPYNALLAEMLGQYNGGAPDVIWFEHSILFPFAKEMRRHFPEARLVCNAHNVEYCLQRRVAQIAKASSVRKWYEMQAEASRRIEQEAFKQCDLVFCCSEEDARLVRQLSPRASVAVIPNGVDTNYFRPATETGNQRGPDGRSRPRLIFTGAMGYEPNCDAVGYFVREILPLVRQREPGCRFCIAGSGAQTRFGHLAQTDPLIDIASDVADMRPYFEMSDVVVVPLRAGGGTRTKILEAMAMKRAVVSTSLGAEGIALTPNVHLCLADAPADFAKRTIDLLRDEGGRQKMEEAARHLVCQHYDWNRLMDEASGIFQQRAGAGQAPPEVAYLKTPLCDIK